MRKLLLPLLLLALPALAKPQPPVVPDPLQVWLPWVLDAQRDLLCAGLGDGRQCVWPGHLAVTIDGQLGQFTLDVWLDAAENVALPGDVQAWPLQVLADGKPALVEALEDHPHVALPAGHHTVTGQFAFGQIPQLLAVPDEVGVVELKLGNQRVELPRRDGEGRLFLRQETDQQKTEEDALTVTVARQLVDGVPLRVVTRLTLRMAGRPRDLVLGKVLLADARPVSAHSELPMQIAADGALRVHGRPGQFTVDITAVQLSQNATLTVPQLAITQTEAQETWVWVPHETLRSVELSGLQPIDPERTQLPDDWKHAGRAYVATPGQTLVLKETRRGETEPPPNRLNLKRDLWLDLDGQQWTAHDRFDGEMFAGWRLDVLPGVELGQVTTPAHPGSLLITADPQTKRAGVELRDGKVQLEADERMPVAGGKLQAVGWESDVQQLGASLHLPPGWQLLAVTGVDRKPQTWLDSWDLFDFFFVLLVAAAALKLLGRMWGILALVALALCHDQPDAPEGLWLNVLAALALARVVTQGKLGLLVRLWHGASVIALVLAIVPFARDQVREGLYPQVAQWGKAPMAAGTYAPTEGMNALGLAKAAAVAEMEPPATPAAPPEAKAEEKAKDQDGDARQQVLGSGSGLGYRSTLKMAAVQVQTQQQLRQLDPGAVVQTGPGVPRWQWTTLDLGWSGPVRRDQEVNLWLLNPLETLLLALIRVLLVVVLGLRLIDRERLRALAGRMGTLALLGLIALAHPEQAQAEMPNQQLLDELGKRLTAAQQCDGPCVVVSDLKLQLNGDELTATAEVSAQKSAGWGLPGPWDPLQIREVRVDGQVTDALRRLPGGLIALRIPAGPHVVTLTGKLVHRSVVTLQLDPSILPRHLQVTSREWTAEGLQPGQVKDSLQLTRVLGLPSGQTMADAETEEVNLPPWFQVERQLLLGLPWKTHTTVTRETPGRPEVLKVPLLPGEHVISEGVLTETDAAGKRWAVLHLESDSAQVEYEAELPVTPTLQLTVPEGLAFTETWRLSCSPMWQCQSDGLPPVQTRSPQTAELEPLWQPWPGEKLQLTVQKPLGTKGAAVTIDDATYDVTPGERLLEATVKLSIRTSQGGTQTLTLPDGAEVQTVTYGGQARSIRPQGRKLALPLEPGAQEIVVKWQQPWDRTQHEVVPPLDLGTPAVNVLTTLHLGDQRWLLWAHGPKWGPAVLLWSHVLLLILAAFLLGRLRGLPVKTRHWLLLGLGLVQVPAPILGIVIAWFVALHWRQIRAHQEPPLRPWLFNLGQLFLVGLTLAFFGTLYFAVHANLLGEVDMQVSGAGSGGQTLTWYSDRVPGALPQPGVLSLPLSVWRVAMLLWALWLVAALLRWLPWAWRAVSAGGVWRRMGKPRVVETPISPP